MSGDGIMKQKLGVHNCMYPMPIVLVGTNVNNKPNYITIAHVGILDLETISVSINQEHYSCAGIRDSKAFSINIPSVDMLQKVDYCGIASGDRTDKSELFENFIGEKTGTPMITECPVNIECELVDILNYSEHDIYIGKIVETYCKKKYVIDNKVDVKKIKPILFSPDTRRYYKLGKEIGQAWEIGEELFNTSKKEN